MKTLTKLFTAFVVMTLLTQFSQAQIQIQGMMSENEGCAGWNADGTGPELYGNGHGNFMYYLASSDYVHPFNLGNGGHMTRIKEGFTAFENALEKNGYTLQQVKLRFGLSSLGDDIEGIDWFSFENGKENYLNFYQWSISMLIDDVPILVGKADYNLFECNQSTGGLYQAKTSYFVPRKIVNTEVVGLEEIASAFLSDIEGYELVFSLTSQAKSKPLQGNGRLGKYFSFIGSIEKGQPQILFQGLYHKNEGFALWDAIGTGPEPFGDGHFQIPYYKASVDYSAINPDPKACLGHFVDVSAGFLNTMLQLRYRGFEMSDLRIKTGLASLGPDVEGEDWSREEGNPWYNYYNNLLIIELNGVPILTSLEDVDKHEVLAFSWMSSSSVGKLYEHTATCSNDEKYVAMSILKDLGSHQLKMINTRIQYVTSFSGNGRHGQLWEIPKGTLAAVHENASFIPGGNVCGTWKVGNSPYYIEGNLTIPSGQTLTIEPGVKVAVRGAFNFDVQGNIIAKGTAENMITFTSSNPNLWWDGFDYNQTPVINDASVFSNCIFQHSRAQGGYFKNSGAVFNIMDYDKLQITNSTFRNNKADIKFNNYPSCGGAIFLWNSGILLQNCTFYNNQANDYGGAMMIYYNSKPVISNCLFYENSAKYGGAMAFYRESKGIVINNTIAENTADFGGALFFFYQSNPEIINSVLWGNKAGISGQQVYSSILKSNPSFYYCDIQKGAAGFEGSVINGGYFGNIEKYPEFRKEPAFAIFAESPCYNTGTPDTSTWYYQHYLPETCICGQSRICGCRIDIGAYELETTEDSKSAPILSGVVTARPNPFKSETSLVFELDVEGPVTVEIYNAVGAQVEVLANSVLQAGEHILKWNNSGLPDGIYFCRIHAGGKTSIIKLIKTR
jgi:hypothetical protein